MRKAKTTTKRARAMPITPINAARAVALGVAPFDAAEFLDSPEVIAEFLTSALDDDDPAVFLRAVEAAAKARGMTQVAKDSGLTREALYRSLAPGSHPRHDTVRRVLGALGVQISVRPQVTSHER
jgi:probable addiction module antidote protein